MTCYPTDYESFRTPNQLVFVAICQRCGLCATSLSDAGAAIWALDQLHDLKRDTMASTALRVLATTRGLDPDDSERLTEIAQYLEHLEVALGLREEL